MNITERFIKIMEDNNNLYNGVVTIIISDNGNKEFKLLKSEEILSVYINDDNYEIKIIKNGKINTFLCKEYEIIFGVIEHLYL